MCHVRLDTYKRHIIGGVNLELNLSNTVQLITVIGFIVAVVKYTIISPLQTAITTLNQAVGELKAMLKSLENDQKNIDTRLIRVEESTKSAHKRIDGLEA